MNQVVIVGRLLSMQEKEGYCLIKIKNESSEYPIEVRIFTDGLITSMKNYGLINSIIGIKGEIHANNRRNYVVGTKVSFLSRGLDE